MAPKRLNQILNYLLTPQILIGGIFGFIATTGTQELMSRFSEQRSSQRSEVEKFNEILRTLVIPPADNSDGIRKQIANVGFTKLMYPENDTVAGIASNMVTSLELLVQESSSREELMAEYESLRAQAAELSKKRVEAEAALAKAEKEKQATDKILALKNKELAAIQKEAAAKREADSKKKKADDAKAAVARAASVISASLKVHR